MTTYLGFDVLDFVRPNRINVMSALFAHDLAKLDYGTGAVLVDDKSGVSKTETEHAYLLDGRANIATLKSFVDARKGKAVPFWVPTWQRDLVPTLDISSVALNITVEYINYTNLVYPSTPRHYITFISSSGAQVYKKVSNTFDNGDGTETLTLSNQVGQAYSKDQVLISYLTLCRLSEDATEYTWHHRELAEVSLKFIEIVTEVPI